MRLSALHLSLLLAAATAAADDRVLLADGNTLSGSVTGIGEDGRVLLESEIAGAPFEIRREAVKRISFESAEGSERNGPEVLHLANGDTLPGEFVQLDPEALGFRTDYSGTLTVPRVQAQAVDFGVTPQRLVFRGPGEIHEWDENDDWQSAGSTFMSTSSSSIARANILPEQFILRFRLEWEGNPSLRFYFCDELLKVNGDSDRYYFEINSAGMQLKRQTKDGGRRWFPLASLARKPDSFPNATVDVELRVDRFQRIIYININGESQGLYRDPIDEFPAGTGILLQSLAGGDMKNIISRIEIYEWDAVSQLRRNEGHEDVHSDALISSSGERFSGVAEKFVAKEDGDSKGILFSSPHSDESFIIPRKRISTLYFRRQEAALDPPPTHLLQLGNTGKLHLSGISLAGDTLTGIHPLLGEISVKRDTLLSIEALSKSENGDPEESETP